MTRLIYCIRALPAVGFIVLLAAAYWSTLGWLVGRWRTDPFYSHGPLVPIVSLGLLWMRRSTLRLRPAPSRPAYALLGAALLLHLAGARLMFEFLSAVSLVAVLAAAALLAGGRPLLRAAAFPLAYLLFAIPLPMILLQQVSLPLQLFSSVCAAGALDGLGVEVQRHGVLLVFPKFTLAVADACSGLRSLLTVLAISTLAASLSAGSVGRKAALVALSSAAALLVNILRIALAGLIGVAFDGETACLLFERYSGYFFFALVVLSTLAVFKLLRPPGEAPAAPPAPEPQDPVPAPLLARHVGIPFLAAVLLLAGGAKLIRVERRGAPPAALAGWQPSIPRWTTAEMLPLPAFPGEEAIGGILKDAAGRAVRFNVLHSVSGRYLHSPEACSMAAGWIPERQDLREQGGLPVNVWVLRRGNDRACVMFWFDLGGTPRRGSVDQHVGALGRRLLRGRVDSAYTEIVVPLPIGATADEPALLDLARALHEQVRARLWP